MRAPAPGGVKNLELLLKIHGLKIGKNRRITALNRSVGASHVTGTTSTRYASGHLLACEPDGCTLRCPGGAEHALDWRHATALDADPHETCPACGVPIGDRLEGERSPFATLRAHAPGYTPPPPSRGGGPGGAQPA